VVAGWCSVEELTLWGFSCSPVVMGNEAHNGLARRIRTREAGVHMIQAAHQAGGQAAGNGSTAPAGRWFARADPGHPALGLVATSPSRTCAG
jgi:hypothetical protein